ncbi:hypothetical protein IH982_03210 [Patescibacteria group bacterium]|nr:hypothetical protein [Patescibacteria group bacterium]
MITPNLRKVIAKLGFQDAYIQRKAEEVLSIARTKGLHIEHDALILVCYDMNGPLTSTRDTALHPITGIQEAIGVLEKDNIQKALVSGWDMTTLARFRDQRLQAPYLHIVGELGMVWDWKGEVQEVSPIAMQEVYRMKEILYREVARENLKIGVQGNKSSRITGVFFEAEGFRRANLVNHLLLKGKKITTKDIFQSLQNEQDFVWDDDRIIFPCKQPYIQEIDRVLRTVFTLHSVRLALEKDRIALWVDHIDKEDYSPKDMKSFFSKILPAPWEVFVHDDFGAEIMFRDEEGKKISKESTAHLLGERLFNDKPFILTHVGDRSSDVFIGDDSIFFAQKGTSAEMYCIENNIPYISVMHGGDYSLILAALLKI